MAASAAASVLAKQERDALLTRLALRHPGYGLERHAGYGTPQHREAILREADARGRRTGDAEVTLCGVRFNLV